MTDAIDSTVFDEWSHLKAELVPSLFDGRPFSRGEWLFRGHRSAEHGLTSSFDRWFERWGGTADRLELSGQLLESFHQELSRRGHDWAFGPSCNETCALAQHYGVPTRMLDWSESPYVAAFFAFHSHLKSDDEDSHEIALWALRSDHVIWKANAGVEVVRVRSSGNDRLRNQEGVFTINRSPYATIEEYAEAQSTESVALRKFIVPVTECAAALSDLSAMGIAAGRLFPGLAGIAEETVHRMLIRLKT